MDFDFTTDEQIFRSEVQAFLADNLTKSGEEFDADFLEEWDKKVAAQGWLGFAWPPDVGGSGASLIQQFILKEEMSAARAPRLGRDFMGLTWVGPAIISHGTDAQKNKFLPDLLSGQSLWCTGYSEPGSGSDLASLSTQALRDGNEYVINGQKIWTTLAHEARWMFLLARTDTSHRYSGITCLLVPMDTPGITVRPIPSLLGGHSFNEVFFDDVRIPVENRLGAEGEGWRVVVVALANERSGISESTEMLRHLEDLEALASRSLSNGQPALEDASVRRQLASFRTRISAMRLNGMRHLTQQLRGNPPSSETSVNKLLRAHLEIEMDALAMGLLGNDGQREGHWQSRCLSYHGTVIGGGTPNIQRNIIAERILGLPKD